MLIFNVPVDLLMNVSQATLSYWFILQILSFSVKCTSLFILCIPWLLISSNLELIKYKSSFLLRFERESCRIRQSRSPLSEKHYFKAFFISFQVFNFTLLPTMNSARSTIFSCMHSSTCWSSSVSLRCP